MPQWPSLWSVLQDEDVDKLIDEDVCACYLSKVFCVTEYRNAWGHTSTFRHPEHSDLQSGITEMGAANGILVPKRDAPEKYWFATYMQEDFLASVLPDEDWMRSRILGRLYYPLTAEAEAETRAKNPEVEQPKVENDQGGGDGNG